MSDAHVDKKWQSRPWFARALRVILVVAPFVCGWIAIRATQGFFYGAELTGFSGALVFLVQAIVVSVLVAMGVSRLLHRWTPLVALFEMSLVFPDHAPSRFKMALRSSSVKKLLHGNGRGQLSSDVQTAAEQAVQLVSELAKHDRLTRGHTERVRAYADVIGQEFGLSEKDLNGLRWGALLHDVGKMAVPPEILNKPGKPTDEEWAILRNHPTAAIALLEPLEGWLGDWLLAASQHHERWDGTGYPAGLSGTEISLAGRIVAVADAYDVITSRRSYKAPATAEQARKELVRSAGSHFDPTVVRAMLEAGLRNSGAATRFGWVLEAPGIARFLQLGGQAVTSVAGSTAAAAAAVAVAATAAVGGGADPTPPPQIAFSAGEDTANSALIERPDFDITTPTTTAVVTTTVPGQAPSTTTATTEAPTTPTEPGDQLVSTTAPSSSTTSSLVAQDANTPTTTTTQALTTTTIQASAATPQAPTTTEAPATTRAPTATTTEAPATTRAPTTTTTQAPTTTTAPCEVFDGGTSFRGDLTDCDLSGQNLAGLDFFRANLRGVDFSNAVINDTSLIEADLRGANFSGATFVNGAAIDADLTGANFSGASISFYDMSRANLRNADLRDVDFESVSFSLAEMRDADFRGATFSGTNFVDADDMRGTDFSGNSLDGVQFIRANIEGMIISNTTNTGTSYQDATGRPIGHATASFLQTICPDSSSVDQSCW